MLKGPRLNERLHDAAQSVALARATLGDSVIVAIVARYAEAPNNARTRRAIIEDIRAAMAAKLGAAVSMRALDEEPPGALDVNG